MKITKISEKGVVLLKRFVWKTKNANLEFSRGSMQFHNENAPAKSIDDVCYFYYTATLEMRKYNEIAKKEFRTHDSPKADRLGAYIDAIIGFDTKKDGYLLSDHGNRCYYHQIEQTGWSMREYFFRWEKYHYVAGEKEHVYYNITIGEVPAHHSWDSEVCETFFFHRLQESDLLRLKETANAFVEQVIKDENAAMAFDCNKAEIPEGAKIFFWNPSEKEARELGSTAAKTTAKEALSAYCNYLNEEEETEDGEDKSADSQSYLVAAALSETGVWEALCGAYFCEPKGMIETFIASHDDKCDFHELLYGRAFAPTLEEKGLLLEAIEKEEWDETEEETAAAIAEKLKWQPSEVTKEDLAFLLNLTECSDVVDADREKRFSLQEKIIEAR